jgi:hypothetical protein
MRDIVGYKTLEAREFARALSLTSIPCFGPSTGRELLNIVKGIDAYIGTEKRLPVACKNLILGYRQRIIDICSVSAFQQEEVIKQLEQALKHEAKHKK